MTTHRLSLYLSSALACLLPLADASAQSKVDLSAFFATEDQVGDFRVFESPTGPVRRAELLEMTPVGKKIRFLARYYEAGELVSIEESFAVPGKKLQIGDVIAGDLELDFPKPKTTMPLRMAVGKPFRYKGAARLFYLGERAGKVKISGSVTFMGFEAHATPYFERDQTARLEQVRMLTFLVRGAPVFATVSHVTSWVAADLATMAYTEQVQHYEDGVLVEDSGVVEYWLESGVFGGVPVP